MKKARKQLAFGDLCVSPVRFIDEESRHEYWYMFDQLRGVTGMLNDVFGNKYPDTPAVREAARRGTATHIGIQTYEQTGKNSGSVLADTPYFDYAADTFRNVLAWVERRVDIENLRTIETEYLVSNCTDLASKIDIVLQDRTDYSFTLADIKTSKELDTERYLWQLSIYAYLFEKQTGYAVNKRVLIIHVREGRCELVWLDRKTTAEVEQLIEDWRAGINRTAQPQVPAELVSLGNVYADLERKAKAAAAERDEFRSRMLDAMREAGVQQVKTDDFTCTYIAPAERETYDTKKLVAEHPELADLFGEYLTRTKVRESVRITIK